MARAVESWMPLYWGDYLKKTARFTLAHHGAYMLLIAEYWTTGAAIPADPEEQALIVRVPVKEWMKLRPKIAEKFDEREGKWHHGRIDLEIAKAVAKHEAKAKAGANGAQKRWQKDSKPIAQPSGSHKQTDAPLPSHSPNGENISLTGDGAKRPRATKGTRLAVDWKPCQAIFEHGQSLNLTDDETRAICREFYAYFVSPDATKPIKRDWDGACKRWITRDASRVIGRRPRQRGTAANTGRNQSLAAAHDSILAKAGVRRAGGTNPVSDRAGNATGTDPIPSDSGTVIDADGWRRMPESSDGAEGSDEADAGDNGRHRVAVSGVPETADEIPGGCGEEGSDDAAGFQPVVAVMAGPTREVGASHVPEAEDVGGGDGLDIPPFLRRFA